MFQYERNNTQTEYIMKYRIQTDGKKCYVEMLYWILNDAFFDTIVTKKQTK